jgi:DNA invertase Pin-like site-specific DNA recombinase
MPSEAAQFAASLIPQDNVVEVVLEKLPVYERRAKEFQSLNANGASAEAIAAMNGLYPTTVRQALKFAETGERPNWGPKRKPKGTGGKATRYKEIAPEVVRMVDEEAMKFPDVADKLNVGVRTVRRAYDFLKPDAVRAAVTNGTRTKRRKPTRLSHEVFHKIQELAGTGISDEEIAKKAGCHKNTVKRELTRLAEERQASSSADQKTS